MYFKELSACIFGHTEYKEILWHQQWKGGGDTATNSFCMLLKLGCYKCKSKCYNFRIVYVIAMVIKKIVVKYIPNDSKKEFKHFTTKTIN